MRQVIHRFYSCLLLFTLILPGIAEAGIQVTGTRFIYPESKREIIVNLNNTSNHPSLVQAWLDAGDPTSLPGALKLPFVILPPLVRVEAGKGQSLRIIHTKDHSLPQDRESVFWLSILDVPPRAKGLEGKNIMQMAFRTRLKLFYRPEGLVGSPKSAAEALKWSVVPKGQSYVLSVRNDAAYHVSFSRVVLTAGNKTFNLDAGGMVKPHETYNFPLKGAASPISSGVVEGYWLDDFGSSRRVKYTLNP
ncbi:fimbria/pilus periplasmic chaperone [Pseudescherichia vulneris]